MGTRTHKQRRGFGWAWEFKPMHGADWELCHWAVSHKAHLNQDDSKPSDEARPVRVEFVPTSKKARKRYGY